MRIVEGLLLLFCIAAMWYFVRNDISEYAAFKLLANTKDRQRTYRAWILKSLLVFSGTAIAGLAILRRLRALVAMPLEFRGLADSFPSVTSLGNFKSGFLIGICIPIAIGTAVGVMLVKRRSSKSTSSIGFTATAGDLAALMPGNWAETAHTTLLSLNAGLSEELFFRLFLPLLLALLLGKAKLAFVLAGFIFRTVHIYQGALGVIATTILGFVLTAIYLTSGSIWIAVGIHAAIDLVGLVVRPTIARLITATDPTL